MGDNILESQAKNTKKRRSRKQTDLEQGRLFIRGNDASIEFTVDCDATDSSQKVGDVLHCFPGRGKAPVDVVHENRKIGVVDEGGGATLRKILAESGCKSLIVTNVCELTNTLKAQFKRDQGIDGFELATS